MCTIFDILLFFIYLSYYSSFVYIKHTYDIQIYFLYIIDIDFMYYQQQNKWHPKRCLLAHFEARLDFIRSEFTCTDL